MNITKSEMMSHVIFIIAVFVAALMVYGPLTDLFRSPMYENYHSLIPFIPLITVYLLYIKLKDVRESMRLSIGMGAAVIVIGIISFTATHILGAGLNENDYATITVSSALVVVWGAFILAYGFKAFTTVLFPLLFLVFMIPVPAFIMDEIIVFLQTGSTECANFLFWLSRAPYYREGFFFQLPGMSVVVRSGVQRNSFRSGTFYHGSSRGTFVFTNFVEKNHTGTLRVSDHHV